MAGAISADTGKIKTTAQNIGTEASAFQNAFQQMYQAVTSLKSSFTGTDGQSYIAKIESFQPDFEAMFSKLTSTSQAVESIGESLEKVVQANTVN